MTDRDWIPERSASADLTGSAWLNPAIFSGPARPWHHTPEGIEAVHALWNSAHEPPGSRRTRHALRHDPEGPTPAEAARIRAERQLMLGYAMAVLAGFSLGLVIASLMGLGL